MLPYDSGFDEVSEHNGWQIYTLISSSNNPSWGFTSIGSLTAPYSLNFSAPFDGEEISECWIVSPPIDFSKGGIIDSIWYHFSGMGTIGIEDTMAMYLLVGKQDPRLANTRKRIILFSDSNHVPNEWEWKSRVKVPLHTNVSEGYIAFQHRTRANWINIKIDNLSIKDTVVTSVNEHLIPKVTWHPNPSSGMIQMSSSENVSINRIEVFNDFEKLVDVQSNDFQSLNLSLLPDGLYYIKVISKNGSTINKIIKH
ncbi:MAG: hypothetical protein ACJAUV_000072 [Flavobacteriales bacterium]|jgi:hypothetical protein